MTPSESREKKAQIAAMRDKVKTMPKGPEKKLAGAIVKHLAAIDALQRR